MSGVTTNLKGASMNADEVIRLSRATLDVSMPFPEIVGKRVAAGVEPQCVGYSTSSFASPTYRSLRAGADFAPK